MKRKQTSLPGFGLTMGYTILYLSLLILIPIAFAYFKASELGPEKLWKVISDPRVVASYILSFSTAFYAALVNLVIGTLTAWVLVRYEFPGRRIIDSLVDLPFALPTAVAGIALAALLSPNGWVGSVLKPLGISLINDAGGITIALIFIGFPFIVRSVQPVLEELEPELEEAAACLGASRFFILRKIILPTIFPAIATGFTLAFARALGEYGSVIFIAGNIPMKTEITPLLVMTKLDQYDYAGAAALGAVLLTLSFLSIFILNLLQTWQARRIPKEAR